MLKRKKLVEGKRPNLHISSNVANCTDQKDNYIKMKGIDDGHYQSLIIKYLKEFKTGKREDFERLLLDKLPEILDDEQKKNKIKNYLQTLRRSDTVVCLKRIWSLN